MTAKCLRRAPITDTSALIKILEEDGCVIATGFTTKEEVEQVNTDMKPYVMGPNDTKGTEYFKLDTTTRRATRNYGRSEVFREKWCQKPEWLTVLNHFLHTKSRCWRDDEVNEFSTPPVISITISLAVGPGAEYQPLHRDDAISFQQMYPKAYSSYPQGHDISMGFFVPGVPTTKANGATDFILGSHLWDDTNPPKREDTVPAEMEVGEALIFLASVYHSAGANSTNDYRLLHGAFWVRNWVRPEENHFPWFTKEEVETWSEQAQTQAGYGLGVAPYLGSINLTAAKDKFRASGPLDPMWDNQERLAN